MLKTDRFFQITFILFATQTSHLCLAMNDAEDLRREVLKVNARTRIYERMRLIKEEKDLKLLTRDEQYFLLTTLHKDLQSPPTEDYRETFEKLQIFFDALKKYVSTDILAQALPPLQPPQTVTVPTIPPRNTPPDIPPRTDIPPREPTPFSEDILSQPRGYRELDALEEEAESSSSDVEPSSGQNPLQQPQPCRAVLGDQA